ncbi:hypothetical protein KY290_009817 [Solanum tuberosum]|uniref:Uncharacterized protein n=1 Tax=Solanum tuberosum TaxID=4113 RepID=A0ABQ7VY33_SOLTU|nr:hypothetical protein KY290_009817 [Solanum tuberosum]
MKSVKDKVYADLTPTSKVERLIPIDPLTREKTVQSSLVKVMEVQETTITNDHSTERQPSIGVIKPLLHRLSDGKPLDREGLYNDRKVTNISCLWDGTDPLSFRSINLRFIDNTMGVLSGSAPDFAADTGKVSAVAIGVEHFAEVLNLCLMSLERIHREVIFKTDQVLTRLPLEVQLQSCQTT